jgi:hypothetical protein
LAFFLNLELIRALKDLDLIIFATFSIEMLNSNNPCIFKALSKRSLAFEAAKSLYHQLSHCVTKKFIVKNGLFNDKIYLKIS